MKESKKKQLSALFFFENQVILKKGKFLGRFGFESFYNDDQTVKPLYKDDFMEISAVGENPKIIDSTSKLKRRAQKAMAIRKRRNE